MEKWLLKMVKLAEMAELTTLISEKKISALIADWKPLIDFLCETKQNPLMIMVLMIGQDR